MKTLGIDSVVMVEDTKATDGATSITRVCVFVCEGPLLVMLVEGFFVGTLCAGTLPPIRGVYRLTLAGRVYEG